jgi:hypothetical protein
MYSNTLSDYFFYKFNAAGYNIEIIRYDVQALAVGLPGEMWVGRISEWQTVRLFSLSLSLFISF